MLYDERKVRLFLTIVEEKNLSRSAEKLYVSQPSLSRFLSNLETEVGMPLFERKHTQMLLTPAGELYLKYVKEMVHLEEELDQKLFLLNKASGQKLRVGIGTITGPDMFRYVFPVFREKYPDIRLELTEGIHSRLWPMIEKQELDLALFVGNGEGPIHPGGLLLAESPRILMTSVNHPLASLIRDPVHNSPLHPQLIEPKDINGQTMISGVPGQQGYEDLVRFEQKHELHFAAYQTSQSMESGVAMAEAAMGLFIFSQFYYYKIKNTFKCVYFTIDDPLFYWKMYIRFAQDKPSEPALTMAELTRQAYDMLDRRLKEDPLQNKK